MKRVLVISILCCLLLTLMIVVSYAEDTSSLTTATIESDVALDSNVAPDPYFPFIYDSEWNYKWLGEELDSLIATLNPDHMYVADMDSLSVNQVLDERVTAYQCNSQYIFAITESDQIVRVDYEGNGYTIIYNRTYGELGALEYKDFALYFADGDKITRINTLSGNTEILLSMEDVVFVYPYKTGHLLLEDTNDGAYTYDEKTKELVRLEDEKALDELWNSTSIPLSLNSQIDAQVHTDITTATRASTTTTVNLPLSEYPAGSYFTTTGNACQNHNSCKRYASTNQCDGFARYVNEHYYHVAGSTWSTPYGVSGDLASSYNKYQAFGTTSALYQFFNQLEKGAYVRVSRRNQAQDSTAPYTSQGSHSFVYISHNSTGAVLYEANLDNKCGVSYKHRTFTELLSRYPYFFGWVNHDQNGVIKNSSDDYHRIYCSHTGCVAYVQQRHSYRYVSNRYVCDVCGDTTTNPGGNIVMGYQ